MEQVNALLGFFMGLVSQFFGWVNSFMGVILPGSSDAAGKERFVKWGFIVLVLFFVSKVFRFNIKTGGK